MPALTGFSPTLTFGENTVNATPQVLDGDVAFTDAEGDFNGGHLDLTGVLAEDRISVRNEGVGVGQIGLSGTDVTYGGVPSPTAPADKHAGDAQVLPGPDDFLTGGGFTGPAHLVEDGLGGFAPDTPASRGPVHVQLTLDQDGALLTPAAEPVDHYHDAGWGMIL